MKSPAFQGFTRDRIFFLSGVFLLVVLTRCGEDTSRQRAVKEAKNAPAKPAPAPSQPQQPATSGFISLSLGKLTAVKGSQVCVPVTTRDFKKIVSMQYTVLWDKSVLKFREVRGFNLPGLTAANFGTHLAEKEGLLTHAWLDMNVKGIDKPDGDKLYEICFDAAGAPGSKSDILFAGKPTPFEFTNAGSQFLELQPVNGTVEVR